MSGIEMVGKDMLESYKVIEKALFDHYGTEAQVLQLCEECGELIQAASKVVRQHEKGNCVDNMVEEIADVMVMCRQFLMHFNINDTMIETLMKQKILRQYRRIQEASNGDGN